MTGLLRENIGDSININLGINFFPCTNAMPMKNVFQINVNAALGVSQCRVHKREVAAQHKTTAKSKGKFASVAARWRRREKASDRF